MGGIAKIWRAGCIIRADLLSDIMHAYRRDPDLVNLLLDDAFREAVESRQEAWRNVVQAAIRHGHSRSCLECITGLLRCVSQ